MKKNVEKEYDQIISILKELNKNYPSYSMGRHISTALDEYDDIWGMSDKEFLFAIDKYATTLEIDSTSIDDDKFLSKIIQDGKHLFDKNEEEEDDDYNIKEEEF